jgi:hypothetical protein
MCVNILFNSEMFLLQISFAIVTHANIQRLEINLTFEKALSF